jgi:hypothetical protein
LKVLTCSFIEGKQPDSFDPRRRGSDRLHCHVRGVFGREAETPVAIAGKAMLSTQSSPTISRLRR